MAFQDLRQLLQRDDNSKHMLNDVFVTDYCVWIQAARSECHPHGR